MEESKITTKCFICEQEFSQDNLKAHFLDCDQEHKCGICDKVFQTKNLLKNHKTIHGKGNERHLKSKMHIHRIPDGHKDYKCEFCGKSFSEGGKLKKHILTIHEGHKDYRCESCGKSFSQAGALKKHICMKNLK